jgi:hypothetical protein
LKKGFDLYTLVEGNKVSHRLVFMRPSEINQVGNVNFFYGGRKTGEPGEKPLKEENQQTHDFRD